MSSVGARQEKVQGNCGRTEKTEEAKLWEDRENRRSHSTIAEYLIPVVASSGGRSSERQEQAALVDCSTMPRRVILIQ